MENTASDRLRDHPAAGFSAVNEIPASKWYGLHFSSFVYYTKKQTENLSMYTKLGQIGKTY